MAVIKGETMKGVCMQFLQLVLRHVQDAVPSKGETMKGVCMQHLQLVVRDVQDASVTKGETMKDSRWERRQNNFLPNANHL